MDDLASKLQELLNSPQGQENIKNVAEMLGGQGGSGGGLDLSALSSVLGGQGGGGLDLSALTNALGGGKQSAVPPKSEPAADTSGFGGLDINMLLKIKNILGSMSGDNEKAALIRAVRPHVKPERQHRVDEAIRIMQLITILPMLKESGLLGDLLG